MQLPTVAVGPDLSPFGDQLRAAGFDVVELNPETMRTADAVVVDGMEQRFLGVEMTDAKAPVIDADGMTPDQVVKAVKARALRR